MATEQAIQNTLSAEVPNPPVCPNDQSSLTWDGKRVRCEHGHEWGPNGWGFDVTTLPGHRDLGPQSATVVDNVRVFPPEESDDILEDTCEDEGGWFFWWLAGIAAKIKS